MLSLRSISNKFSSDSNQTYNQFGEYCSLLDKGFRKEALKKLGSFLSETKTWELQERVDFCSFLFKQLPTSEDTDFGLLKIPLMDELVGPTLNELKNIEPNNFLPFKWEGQWFRKLDSARRAYELNPADESTKILLLRRLEYSTWLSIHHLPGDYYGDLEEDESDIALAFKIISEVDSSKTVNFNERFQSYSQLLQTFKAGIQ